MTENAIPHVTAVRHVRDYLLELSFSDGVVGQIDFQPWIAGHGGVFAPLQDIDFFRQVRVDHEVGTIVWPNDVDFCPSVLHDSLTAVGLTSSR